MTEEIDALQKRLDELNHQARVIRENIKALKKKAQQGIDTPDTPDKTPPQPEK